MAQPRLRVALDANVLIAGILLPRWPHEVMRACLGGFVDPALPAQVIVEARRHLAHPAQTDTLHSFLSISSYEQLAMPSASEVAQNLDLVRSEKDVPIALALLRGQVDVLVSSDRDFTDSTATAARFQARVRVLLPALFLHDVMGWSSEALEAIRHRSWSDLT